MQKKITPVLIAFFALLAIGCASAKSTPEGKVDAIYNPILKEKTLSVSVVSNGCTQVNDFVLDVKNNLITLVRVTPDLCRKMPELKTLNFEYNFENKEYQFKNEVRTDYRLKPIIKSAE